MRDCESIISSCFCETIRKLLPVKNILKEYLGDEAEENEEDDISKILTNSNNLKMLVQKEIENFTKGNKDKLETEENTKK